MHMKFNIENGMLEWYKNVSLFAKWAIVNSSNTLTAIQLKRKNENNTT